MRVLLFIYRSPSSHFPAPAEPPGHPLLFNPTPKFLGVTFDRTLSFGAHVQSLCSKFYPRHKALSSKATACWSPTKESLYILYKSFVRLVLTYASPGWFPFLCNTTTNHLEVLHRAACRVITGCLSFTPSSLLLQAQLPPLKLTLEHQALSSFERALHLTTDFSSLYALATRNVPCRLQKEPTWRSFCSSATQSLPSPCKTLIMCFPFPPWTATHITVSPLHSRLHRQQYSPTTVCFKQTILPPPSDIQVWTDGSVPSLFGPGGAGVYVTCSKCNTSYSLSFSTGPIASSFAAETFALKKGLDWCTSHLMTCKFQSVLFLTDSQSASQSFHQPPLISCLSPSGMFGPAPPPSPTTPPSASNGSPVTQDSPVMKMRIYLPKLVPPCPLTQSHALSPKS